MAGAKKYQNSITRKLKAVFGENMVKKEWDIAKDSQDDLQRGRMYCPRIDVAVGPFNISREIDLDNQRIWDAIAAHRDFIEKLVDNSIISIGNVDTFIYNRNKNPRCFLAIEIEGSGTRKHMLGDIANASIMAAIGVVIPLDKSRLNGFKGIQNYIEFATHVGKLETRLFKNVLIISKEKFKKIISERRNS